MLEVAHGSRDGLDLRARALQHHPDRRFQRRMHVGIEPEQRARPCPIFSASAMRAAMSAYGSSWLLSNAGTAQTAAPVMPHLLGLVLVMTSRVLPEKQRSV